MPKGGIGAGAETAGTAPGAAGRDSVREGGVVAGIGEGVSFGVGEREGATLGAAGGLVVGKPGAGGLLSSEGEPAGTAGGVGSEDGGGRGGPLEGPSDGGGSGGPLEGPADGGNAPVWGVVFDEKGAFEILN